MIWLLLAAIAMNCWQAWIITHQRADIEDLRWEVQKMKKHPKPAGSNGFIPVCGLGDGSVVGVMPEEAPEGFITAHD